jgi:hypothetical protein
MNFPYLLALLGNTAGKGEGSRYLPYLKDPLLVVLAINQKHLLSTIKSR